MTIAEVNRAIESKRRVKEVEAQEKASYDYILADLVGRSIARVYSSSAKLPEISAVYPSLFNSQELEEKLAEKKASLSAARFKQFVTFHNNKRKAEEVEKN